MQAKALKWGNSLAVRLPKAIARECGIEENTPVEIARSDNKIIVRPLKQGYSLESLLAHVTPDNMHSEAEFGRPAGKELL